MMRDSMILVSPFQFLDILECSIHKAVNTHFTAKISGHISLDSAKKYEAALEQNLWISIGVQDEQSGEKSIFKGLIKSIEIETSGNVKTMTAQLVSGTAHLDASEHTRTFQNSGMTYKALLAAVDNGHVMTVGAGKTIGELIVQYKETDWNFVKRLASHVASVIVPDCKTEGSHYTFGMPVGSHCISQETVKTKTKKLISESCNKPSGANGKMEKVHFSTLQLEDREVYEIGDHAQYNGEKMVVYQIESRLCGQELVHQYYLRPESALHTQKNYNTKIIGASLDATITAVSKDRVKAHVAVDAGYSPEAAKWFLYSTVYSSPDGTGWYCMPEVGDSVRLYFPDEKEKDGYIISAVHKPISGGQRSAPSEKSIMNKHGKQVLFTPSTVTMTNNHGMSVKINDNEGIYIQSDKAIVIQSGQEVVLSSESSKMTVVAPQGIIMEQGNTKVEMQDNVKIEGAKVKAQ